MELDHQFAMENESAVDTKMQWHRTLLNGRAGAKCLAPSTNQRGCDMRSFPSLPSKLAGHLHTAVPKPLSCPSEIH
eukprot:7177030-Pyramimonas_sp.AAC.1